MWAHLPKAAGDATLRLFRLFPELIISADDERTQGKHDFFRDRAVIAVDAVASYGPPVRDPRVSIILPLYCRIDFLEHQPADFADDTDFARVDLLFVANSPEITRDVHDLAVQLAPPYSVGFRVATLSWHVGFATDNTVGAALARSNLLLFLNSNVFPVRPGWVKTTADFYESTPDIGGLGAKLLYEDKSLEHARIYFKPSITALAHLWATMHYFKGLHGSLPAACITRRVPSDPSLPDSRANTFRGGRRLSSMLSPRR